jgi:hypothetical protein
MKMSVNIKSNLREVEDIIKNGKNVYISETPDFLEKMFLLKNYVLITNTCNYEYTLFQFENDDDAIDFFDLIVELSECFAKRFDACPFLFSFQQKFLKTIASYFNSVIIHRGKLKLSLREFI